MKYVYASRHGKTEKLVQALGLDAVKLEDGRVIIVPLSSFPSIKKVPVKDRSKWYLMGGGVTWDSCPEVIHIEQILGNYHNYQHE